MLYGLEDWVYATSLWLSPEIDVLWFADKMCTLDKSKQFNESETDIAWWAWTGMWLLFVRLTRACT